jgi:hypothetical protein
MVVVAALAASAVAVLPPVTITATWLRARRQRRQGVVLTLREAKLDRDIASLDVAGSAQALAKRGDGARQAIDARHDGTSAHHSSVVGSLGM